MAQSSAQRDPSMEEILASIRRIIEEGEEARKPAESRGEFEPTVVGPAANDALRRPLPTAPELRRDVPAVELVAPEVFAPEVRPDPKKEIEPLEADIMVADLNLSLDDFIIDIDEVQDSETADEPDAFHKPVVRPENMAIESTHTSDAGVSNSLDHKQVEPQFTATFKPNTAPTPHSHLNAERDAPNQSAAEKPAALAVETPIPAAPKVLMTTVTGTVRETPRTERKLPILSNVVQKQVAASFTELNEALVAGRRQSLDQIAENMLRPMLQEWLDNNLPTLVERLVREEIERVARGTG